MTAVSENDKEEEKQWPQVMVILVSMLAGITNGMLFSWPSPFLLKITEDKENYNITEQEGSFFNIIHPLAIIIFCPLFSKLMDVIGRKRTLLLIVVPQIASWICSGFAKSVYVFYLARVFSGLSESCIFAALLVYIGEIVNPEVRGTWGNAISISLYCGQFLVNLIGSYLGVRETSYVGLAFPILFFILFMFMPESPYYHMIKGEEEQAKKSLKFLTRKKIIDTDFSSLKKDVARQMSESASWKDLFKINSNRRALVAGLFLRFSQQMSGLTVFNTYTQFIFEKAGEKIGKEASGIIFQGASVILNVIVLFLIVNRFGRRPCFIISVFFAGIALYVLSAYFYLDAYTHVNLSRVKSAPIVLSAVFLCFSSFGVSVLPTLMLSELFSASIKSKAMTLIIMGYGIGSFITNYLFYFLNISLGFYFPFLFFAICNTISAIVGYFIVPETKGMTLEEIQQCLKSDDDFY
ncbi:facilitated trehalose transporter Tret1-like [Diabrotica virgifera virgifera]|uniref:Major facilitator superfamily (MFS) profile domain-containing protein n=1 Tax=Diabrotica virgifera virgifera TaxID=50390 RepID=A0ABM5JJV3_DIAVI|nr:facilitated trehalose transporter Tret1-like [Diabrotica virgifera virgifera]